MLFYKESECLKEFPSPEELKHRIIISTKPPKEYLEAQSFKEDDTKVLDQKDSDDDVWGAEPSCLTADQEDGYKVGRKLIYLPSVFFTKHNMFKKKKKKHKTAIN